MEIHVVSGHETQTTYVYDIIFVISLHVTLIYQMMFI